MPENPAQITGPNTSTKLARKFVPKTVSRHQAPTHHHNDGKQEPSTRNKLALTIGTLLSSQRTDAHCRWSSRPPAGQPGLHYPRIWASTNRLDLRGPTLVTKRKLRRRRFAEGNHPVVDPGPSSVAGCDLRPRCAVPIRASANLRTGERCVKSAGQDRFSQPADQPACAPRSAGGCVDRHAAAGHRAMSADPAWVTMITPGGVRDPLRTGLVHAECRHRTRAGRLLPTDRGRGGRPPAD